MSAAGECESGYKKCGDIAGISKGICMPNSEDCPISEMVFAGSNPDAAKLDNQKLGNNIAVYYTRSSSSQPIIETDMKENDPCYNLDLVLTGMNRSPYPLMIKEETRSCEIDPRWSKQENLSYGRRSTFDLNAVQFQQLPAFQIDDIQKLTRYQRKLIDWNYECNEIVDEFLTSADLIQSVNDQSQLYQIFAWISFGICIVLNGAEICVFACKGGLIRLLFYIPKMGLYVV